MSNNKIEQYEYIFVFKKLSIQIYYCTRIYEKKVLIKLKKK